MPEKPLVSFYTNSYNRLASLKNLLKSFELSNLYPRVEWIIVDYGSEDGSREFIEKYASQSNFLVKYYFGEEQKYFAEIKSKKIPIDSRWARFRAILAKYRNDARQLCAGDYIFDVGSDHQFIRPGNWVEDVFEIFKHRENEVGRDDIACIVNYGYPKWRLYKSNNALESEKNSEAIPYYVANKKSYVDYNIMKRSTYEKIGEFLEPLKLVIGSPEMKMWIEQNNLIQPEADYERRCHKLGLKRIFMKYPILVSFPNNIDISTLKKNQHGLFTPLWSLADMTEKFSFRDRPISSDELITGTDQGFISRFARMIQRWK